MTLQERYLHIHHQYPYWGDVPKLRMAIERGDSRRHIRSAFDRLVNKEDYRMAEREEILDDLYARAGHGSKLHPEIPFIF